MASVVRNILLPAYPASLYFVSQGSTEDLRETSASASKVRQSEVFLTTIFAILLLMQIAFEMSFLCKHLSA